MTTPAIDRHPEQIHKSAQSALSRADQVTRLQANEDYYEIRSKVTSSKVVFVVVVVAESINEQKRRQRVRWRYAEIEMEKKTMETRCNADDHDGMGGR